MGDPVGRRNVAVACSGAWLRHRRSAILSILLVLQIVPYFMTGFESIGKESEEARSGFDPRSFERTILLAAVSGILFYCLIIAAVSLVFPWKELVAGHLGTEAAFERAFSSRAVAQLILLAALLSLIKIFNGNFAASTRLLFGIGKRRLVHPSLARVHSRFGTPTFAILLMTVFTGAAAFLGDALLVPVTEVGSLAVGVGWLATCLSYLLRTRGAHGRVPGRATAKVGAACHLDEGASGDSRQFLSLRMDRLRTVVRVGRDLLEHPASIESRS